MLTIFTPISFIWKFITSTFTLKHEIQTNSSIPIQAKTYRYPKIHELEVQWQISDMLKEGIVSHSFSSWSSSVWIVPKKLYNSGKQK